MNADICHFVNILSYKGIMQNGSEEVAKSEIIIPDNKLTIPFIKQVFSTDRKVVFLNLDKVIIKTY